MCFMAEIINLRSIYDLSVMNSFCPKDKYRKLHWIKKGNLFLSCLRGVHRPILEPFFGGFGGVGECVEWKAIVNFLKQKS